MPDETYDPIRNDQERGLGSPLWKITGDATFFAGDTFNQGLNLSGLGLGTPQGHQAWLLVGLLAVAFFLLRE